MAYLTIEQLDTLVTQLFTSDVLTKVGWGELSEQDKQVYLNNATDDLDSLKFSGVKATYGDIHAFPLLLNGKNTGIPEGVKKALAIMVVSELIASTDENTQLQRLGVKSFSASKISVSFSDTSVASKESLSIDTRALKYLKPYLFTAISR